MIDEKIVYVTIGTNPLMPSPCPVKQELLQVTSRHMAAPPRR
jgi:hypothetical protein